MADLMALVFALLMMSGCGSKMPYLISPPATHAVTASGLTGTFTTSDDTTEDLAKDSDLPTILIFGQDTCEACGDEATRLISALKNPSQAPTKIHLLTVLVGAIVDDAVDWKQLHQVPWTVGIDPEPSLFTQYCPDQTVPCEIVFVPGKGIVLRQNGPADNDTLIQLTGPWD